MLQYIVIAILECLNKYNVISDYDIKVQNDSIEKIKRLIQTPSEYIKPHVELFPQVLQNIINKEKYSGKYLKTFHPIQSISSEQSCYHIITC